MPAWQDQQRGGPRSAGLGPLVARSFEHGVLAAVNHSGDSDSTGSMTGQLLGLSFGLDAIPRRWREGGELGEVIAVIAADLAAVRAGELDADENRDRYPGG